MTVISDREIDRFYRETAAWINHLKQADPERLANFDKVLPVVPWILSKESTHGKRATTSSSGYYGIAQSRDDGYAVAIAQARKIFPNIEDLTITENGRTRKLFNPNLGSVDGQALNFVMRMHGALTGNNSLPEITGKKVEDLSVNDFYSLWLMGPNGGPRFLKGLRDNPDMLLKDTMPFDSNSHEQNRIKFERNKGSVGIPWDRITVKQWYDELSKRDLKHQRNIPDRPSPFIGEDGSPLTYAQLAAKANLGNDRRVPSAPAPTSGQAPALTTGVAPDAPTQGTPPRPDAAPAPTPAAPAAADHKAQLVVALRAKMKKQLDSLSPDAFNAQYQQWRADFGAKGITIPEATLPPAPAALPDNVTDEQRAEHAKQSAAHTGQRNTMTKSVTDKAADLANDPAVAGAVAPVVKAHNEARAKQQAEEEEARQQGRTRDAAAAGGGAQSIDDMFAAAILMLLGSMFGNQAMVTAGMNMMNGGGGRSGYAGGQSNGSVGASTATNYRRGGGRYGQDSYRVTGNQYRPATNFTPLQGLPGLDKKYDELVKMGGVSPSFDPEHRKNPNGPVIILDPGHFPEYSAKNKGATGAFVERDETIRAVRIQKMQLEAQGYHVIVTKHEDGTPAVVNGQRAVGNDLTSRNDVVRLAAAAYPGRVVGFLSYHFDSANASPKTMMIVRNAQPGDPSYDFAKRLADAGFNAYPGRDVVIGTDTGSARKTGVNGVAVLNAKVHGIPHVLLEIAPVSNRAYLGQAEGILANGTQGVIEQTRTQNPQAFATLEPARKALEAEAARRQQQIQSAGHSQDQARALTGNVTYNPDAPYAAAVDKNGGLIGGNMAFNAATPMSATKAALLLTLAKLEEEGKLPKGFLKKNSGTVHQMMQNSTNDSPNTLADAAARELGGSRADIVNEMNRVAKETVEAKVKAYGKEMQTLFTNPVGLNEDGVGTDLNGVRGHQSSAYEQALIAQATSNHPIASQYFNIHRGHTALGRRDGYSYEPALTANGITQGKTGTGKGGEGRSVENKQNEDANNAFIGAIPTVGGAIAVLEGTQREMPNAIHQMGNLVASGKMAPAAVAERRNEVLTLDDMIRGAGGNPATMRRNPPQPLMPQQSRRAEVNPRAYDGDMPTHPTRAELQSVHEFAVKSLKAGLPDNLVPNESGVVFYKVPLRAGNNGRAQAASFALVAQNIHTGATDVYGGITGGSQAGAGEGDVNGPSPGVMSHRFTTDTNFRAVYKVLAEPDNNRRSSAFADSTGKTRFIHLQNPIEGPNSRGLRNEIGIHGAPGTTHGCWGIEQSQATVLMNKIQNGDYGQIAEMEIPIVDNAVFQRGQFVVPPKAAPAPEVPVALAPENPALKLSSFASVQAAGANLLHNTVVTNDAVVATTLAVDQRNEDQKTALFQGEELARLMHLAREYQKQRQQPHGLVFDASANKPMLIQAVATSADPKAAATQAVATQDTQVKGGTEASAANDKTPPAAVIAAKETGAKKDTPKTISA